MKRASAVLAAIAVALVATGHGQSRKAPDFSAAGSDGATHSLKSLTNGKTLVLYFIQSTCPVNAEAVKYYKQIGEAYKGKVNFVGVIDEDEAGYKEWKRQFGNKFPVLYDDEKKLIRSYQAVASPWIVVVSPSGQVTKVHEGYSSSSLTELNQLMAKAANVDPAKLDFTGAPSEMSFG